MRGMPLLLAGLLLLVAVPVWAMRVKKPATFTDLHDTNQLSELNTMLAEFFNLSNGRYTLENLSVNPNGQRKGQKGDLVYATFLDGNVTAEHVCVNTSFPIHTAWTCLNVSTPLDADVVHPTTGIFCPDTLSTVENCEEFRGRIPVGCIVQRIDATVTTAPVSPITITGLVVTGIVVDVNECNAAVTGCTSLWNTDQTRRLAIRSTETTGQAVMFDDNQIAQGNYIAFDIDQVGTSIAGKNLTVTLICE